MVIMKYLISILILFLALSAFAQNNGIIVLKYLRGSGEAGRILYPLATTAINNDSILPKSRIENLIVASAGTPVTSVSGTTNEIASTGGTTPVLSLVNGGTIPGAWNLGTPSALVLTNATGLPNAGLTNSTISGIALGGSLADLTATNATLSFSGTYNGSTARSIGLNLGNANAWTATQTFQNIASLTNNTYDIGATGNVFNTMWGNTFRANTSNALNLRTGGTGQEMVFALGTTTTMMKMMSTTGNIIMQNGGTFTDVTADRLQVSGNINLTTAGNKIKIATGSNASVGTATLVSGTVTVNTTAVTANSIIFITVNTPGGTLGPTYTAPSGSIVAGTSFVINAVGTTGVVTTTDTSTVNWWVIN